MYIAKKVRATPTSPPFYRIYLDGKCIDSFLFLKNAFKIYCRMRTVK